MAWWASAALFLALLALPFVMLWPIVRSAPKGSARLLLLFPAFWAVPLCVCLLRFNRPGYEAVNGLLLCTCLGGWAAQLAIAGWVAWRQKGARAFAAASVLANAPATALSVIALGQGAAGASL